MAMVGSSRGRGVAVDGGMGGPQMVGVAVKIKSRSQALPGNALLGTLCVPNPPDPAPSRTRCRASRQWVPTQSVGTRAAAMRIGFLLAPVLLAACGFAVRAADASAEFFEKKIRPILVEQCYECHSAKSKKVRGGLRLDSRAALLQGGDRGEAVTPGEPDKSLLIEAVGYKNTDVQMPKKGKMSDAEIADLTAWVKMGAPWGKDDGPVAVAPAKSAFDLQQRKRDHWAWRPIHPQEPPAVKDAAWARDPVDRFLLAKLEEKNLSPAPPADKRTLFRRLS